MEGLVDKWMFGLLDRRAEGELVKWKELVEER